MCLEFKYLGCVLGESGTVGTVCHRKVASGRKVGGVIRSQVNARGQQLECARGLQETLVVPVLLYGSETMMWREKERCSIRIVQIDNLRGLLGNRRMNRLPNAQRRELYGVTKRVDENIDESVVL